MGVDLRLLFNPQRRKTDARATDTFSTDFLGADDNLGDRLALFTEATGAWGPV